MTGDQIRTYTLQCIISFLLLGFGLGNVVATKVGFCFLGVGILSAFVTLVIGSRHARFLDAVGKAILERTRKQEEDYHERDVIID